MQAWLEEIKWEQTIKEERKEAYKEAYDEAFQKATEENALANALNLLKMNLGTPEQIAQAVSLPLEQVLALKVELESVHNV